MRTFKSILATALGCLLLVSAVAQDATRAKVGKLGQLNAESNFYLKPDKRSKVLFRGQKELYVVLRSLKEDWATVVMADGKNGFVETKFVDRLPFEVSIKQPERAAPTLQNRGDFVRGANVANGDWRTAVIQEAQQYMGTPYRWGGNDLRAGIDCSGFVQQLFTKYGVSLPRTAQEQSFVGEAVMSLDQLQTGDRLYFTDSKRERITHTGLYMGNGSFIHSSSGNGGVSINSLNENWLRILINIRR